MNRREALAAGGLAGVALGTGCAPRMIVPGGFDAAAALAGLDRALSQTRCIASSLTGKPFTCAPDVPVRRFEDAAGRVAELCSEGARALMVAAFFHDLAPHERLHPEIQTRMHAELPRIGGAVAAMAGAMEQVGPGERRAIQKYLRASPGLEDRIASEVDGHASKSDAPFGKRMQLRRQLGDVAWRMRQQPMDVVIDEIVGKYRKAEAYQRAHADEILALARPPGEGAIPPDQAPGGAPPAAMPATDAPAPGGAPQAVAPAHNARGPEIWWVPGAVTILIGLGALGLGVVGGSVATGSGNVFLATLAVLLIGAGIIVLIIGLLVLAIGGIARLGAEGPKPVAPTAPAPTTPAPDPAPL